MEAACPVPADADPLADLEALGRGRLTEAADAADDLVAGNEGERDKAGFVVDERQVGVAQPAMDNLDFDLFGPEWTGLVPERDKGLTGLGGNPGVYV
jgi:hypothetical protein